MNNNNTGIVFLALFGLTAAVAVAVAVVAAVRGTGNQPAQSNQLAQPSQPINGQSIYGVALEPQTPLAAPVLYENEERWELRRGPDRLIEEIVIHRKVTQNG